MKKFILFLSLFFIHFCLIFSSDFKKKKKEQFYSEIVTTNYMNLKKTIRSDIEKIVRDSFKQKNEEEKEKYFYQKILKLEFRYGTIIVEEVFAEVIKDMSSL